MLALLPTVVIEEAPAALTWSQANGEPTLTKGPVRTVQPSTGVQHPTTSLDGVRPGTIELIAGLDVK